MTSQTARTPAAAKAPDKTPNANAGQGQGPDNPGNGDDAESEEGTPLPARPAHRRPIPARARPRRPPAVSSRRNAHCLGEELRFRCVWDAARSTASRDKAWFSGGP